VDGPMSPIPPARLLVVDDQPANLLALEALLAEEGLTVLSARSGEEALLHARREDEFALILLDVRMPGMSGFETAERLRLLPRCGTTPIIFLTAAGADEEFIARAYSLGAVDYIAKPIVPEILRAKVRVFVELFRKTELVKDQEAQLTRTREMESRELLQRRFIATVSHELRTPIAAIRGSAETLRRGAHEDAKNRLSFVKIIEKHADRLRWLVEDVLALNALDSGQEFPEPRRLDLAAIARAAAGNRKRIKLFLPKDDAVVIADEAHLSRVVGDMLERALRHSPKDGDVELSVSRRDGAVVLSVTDSGTPPKPEEMPGLFEQFHRFADPSRLPDRGLGLYAVRSLVEANGGKVWAELPKGRGLSVVASLREAPALSPLAPEGLPPLDPTALSPFNNPD
jgi:signal transduction histidine kinase